MKRRTALPGATSISTPVSTFALSSTWASTMALTMALAVAPLLGGCKQEADCPLPPDAGRRNSPPVANAGPIQTGKLAEAVTLDGSGSTDPDGDTLVFAWLLTPPVGSSAQLSDVKASKPTFTPDLPGVYTATLSVEDAESTSLPDRTMVVVPLAGPPTVTVEVLGPPPHIVGTAIGLRATASQPPAGGALTFGWSLAAKPPESKAAMVQGSKPEEAQVTPDVAGAYVVIATADDGRQSGQGLAIVDARLANQRPIANAGQDTYVASGSKLRLFGLESSDPEGAPLVFRWTVKSQPPLASVSLNDPNSPTPWALLEVAGTYVFSLVVSDGQDESLPDEVTATVAIPDFVLDEMFREMEAGAEQYLLTNSAWVRERLVAVQASGIDALWVKQEMLNPWETDGDTGPGWVVAALEGEGIAVVGLTAGDGKVVLPVDPPLLWYPHGVFLNQPVVSSSVVTIPTDNGQWVTTVIRHSLTALGKESLTTTAGTYPQALKLHSLLDLGVFARRDMTDWLVEAVGSVKFRVKPEDSSDGPGIAELVWSSASPGPGPLPWSKPLATVTVPRAGIVFDGETADWDDVPNAWLDPEGDYADRGYGSGQDLKRLQMARDDEYFYVRLVLVDPPLYGNVSYSFSFARQPPDLTAGDFTATVNYSYQNGWGAGASQSVDLGYGPYWGSPMVEARETADGFELRLLLSLRGEGPPGSPPLPTLGERLAGSFFKIDLWPIYQQGDIDRAWPSVQLQMAP